MITKICTDVEQSNKLIELGIDVNTADMCYHFIEINKTPLCIRWEKVHDDEKGNSIPAWSLAALLAILPILDNRSSVLSKTFDGEYRVVYHSTAYEKAIITGDYDNPIDACYEMILKLHEQKML